MKTSSLHALVLAATLSGSAFADVITVNGDLSDWLINKNTWTSSLAGVVSTAEDQHDDYLNPGYGGQRTDAEAMYALIQDGKLFIALVTGQNPQTVTNPASNTYGPGDFAIDLGRDGTYDLGIDVINPLGTPGGIYASPSWFYGLWAEDGSRTDDQDQVDKSHPTSLSGGTLIGQAQSGVSSVGEAGYGAWPEDLHYFYEISLDLDVLYSANWDGGELGIHWTQDCANDNILLVGVSGRSVPEPGSLALLGLGVIGLIGSGLRRRSGAVRPETETTNG
jgi:hypothetical protein